MSNRRHRKGDTKRRRKYELNEQLKAQYPPFRTSCDIEVLYLHEQSTIETINYLIERAKRTNRYIIDTESQRMRLKRGEEPRNGAIIQIQLVYSFDYSTVVVIETYYLPNIHSELYKKIKELLAIIFSNNHEIITWGPLKHDIKPFKHLDIIHLGNIIQCDLQFIFSNPMETCYTHPIMESRDDATGCVSMQLDTPGEKLIFYTDDSEGDSEDDEWNMNNDHHEKQRNKNRNPPKSLQAIVAKELNKFLDKSLTINDWSCGIDLSLNTWQQKWFSINEYDEREEKQARYRMQRYAIEDCTSVMELYFLKFPNKINDHITPPETPMTANQSTTKSNSRGRSPARITTTSRRTELTSDEIKRKQEKQREKNKKFKIKKKTRRDFNNPIFRPIYYRYDYKKIRAQLQDDEINHSHEVKINEEKAEVRINFKSEQLREEARRKMPVNYFSRSQYYKRWG